METTRVALIPARGGSQRIPRKNIRSFFGVPALSRVVATLEESGLFTSIVVSTDDDEIAQIAREAGATVPFTRPAALADSLTGARPVIQHAIQALELADEAELAVVYPTAVLLEASDVTAAHELLAPDVEFVMTVAEFPAPIERAFGVDAHGRIAERLPEFAQTRTQDLEPAFHDIGQCYWGRVGAWRTDVPVVRGKTRAYVVPAWRAVDIDTEADWLRAEKLFAVMHG